MTKPIGSRDKVRFETNERVDLGDLTALQENARSESRLLVHNFLFGHGDMGLPDGVTGNTFKAVRDWAGGDGDVLTNWAKSGSASPFAVDAPIAGATVTVKAHWLDSIFAGQTYGGALTGGYAGTLLRGADAELGTACGTEGDSTQTIPLAGLPADKYGVFVSTTFDDAAPGTRVFWDAASAAEDAQSIDTRQVAGWTASVSATSGGAPSDAHMLIATLVWDGTQITTFAYSQNLLFEGLLGSTTGKGPSGNYAQGWGQDGSAGADSYGHRSDDRLYNGVACWQDWAAAIRAQLRDIIGDDDKDGVFGWYTEVAKFVGTGGASGLAGEHASLAHFRDHLDAGTDPHGSTLTQTNLVVSTSANFDGADTNFNSGFFMPNAGGSFLASTPGDLPKFASATSDPQAYSVRRTVLGTEFVDCTPHVASLAGLPSVVESVTERDPRGAVFFYKNTLGNGDYAYDLNKLTAAAALPSDGPELTGIVISFLPPRDLNSVSTDPYPHVATIPPTTQIAQISLWRTENPLVAANGTGARHATPLLIQYASVATLTVPWGTGATADDPAAYSVDLSGVSTSDLQMDTYHNLTLRITLENNRPVDSAANQSTYSFGLNAVAAIFRTRLIHP